jgi:hypothetical protein
MQTVQPLTRTTTGEASPHSGRLARAIVIGGLAVGVLDAVDGVAYFGLTAGQNPIQVLQYIASGALGASSFSGGLATAGLGALLHFVIATVVTSVFLLAWTRIPLLRTHWVAGGVTWGAIVWVVMNLVVVPNSGTPQMPLTALAVIHGLIGHAVTVGLVAAYVGRKVLVDEPIGRRAGPSA